MTTRLILQTDINGKNAFAPEISTDIWTATLVNASEQTITVPGDSREWVASFSFQPGTIVWVARNTTAAVPVGSTFLLSNSTLNPGVLKLYADDVIHLLTSSATAEVSVSLYSVGNRV